MNGAGLDRIDNELAFEAPRSGANCCESLTDFQAEVRPGCQGRTTVCSAITQSVPG